jgi:hypothetical protein
MKNESDVRRQLKKLEHSIMEAERNGRYWDAMVMRYMMDILLWVVE